MPFTEGGFPASSSGTYLGVVNPKIPGTNVNFPGGIASFAAPLLIWVATQLHHRVEKAHAGWCWGWSYRAVRGSYTVLSDHAGAVAIDYNAPVHPRGVHNTWSAAQVREIRQILAEANSHGTVVAWGHDFRTVDDMHFACRGGKAAVIAAGKRLTTPRDWFDTVDKDELRPLLRDVADNAIAAALPKIAAAAGDAAIAKFVAALDDPDSALSRKLRNTVRVPVDAELDERGL